MKHFICGLLFAFLGIPLIENLTNITATGTQYLIYKISKQTCIIKKEIENIYPQNTQEQSEKNTNPIGFQSTSMVGFTYPDLEEEEEEEE